MSEDPESIGRTSARPEGNDATAEGPSVVRFATLLCAWVATPWALAGWSVWAAAGALLLLLALPALLGTPGDQPRVVIAVPGAVTVALVLLQIAVAVAAAWAAWPVWAAVAVTVLAALCVLTERSRWRRLLSGR
uniref:Integral membrane protein n=1 Tax=Streptomyces sp. NBC_00049 TaxID=2903617 RepID=A0AAU2K4Z8_9ACTN